MELETYGAVVSTLRAQGELNKDRRKLLEDLSVLMKISPERHKAEIRRAVNDEKLGCIAERLSGGVDTEWAWALEGRRVVPLMPRLVRPTLFTSLATSVSKAVAQNPRICLNQTPITNTDETPSRYVRDPDDEDTLSPVMVPIASPDSSCHSNNNFECDFMDTPIEKHILISNTTDAEKKPELLSKKSNISVHSVPVKRPRSPSNQQVVNFSAPLPKLIPRGQQITTPIRPQQHLSNPSSLPINTGKIRVRAPIVQANVQRPSITVRPPVPQYAQVQLNQARPVTNNAGVKQVVQIRASSLNQQQQTIGPSKETSIPRSVQTHTPVTVQTVPSVASSTGKQLPGKANVIVLHKNLPMAKTITTVAREVDRSGSLNKNNFLPKSVSTPTGTKVTFPNNVRIISVPSGANVVSGGSGITGVNHATQKIVSTTVTGATTQKNVYVLELSNEAESMKAKVDREIHNEIPSCEEVNDNGLKGKATDSITAPLSHNFTFPTRETLEKNGEHAVVCATTRLVEDDGGIREVANITNVETSILDPHTGVIYAITDEQAPQLSSEPSSVDICSTAIASADINMETAAYSSDENAGITRLILTDSYDSPSAKS
ncbi:hypothetical protein OUZ56_019726 [Daphnia magna]|uniref:ENT domain-containing protein n=1 Tax=Daphnia magna TaxID=35525 RepID=A0ABQ9ZCZ8_9CRUS|nr:hypothetical protein OUZ56_019726 [Daphnia magna]